MSKENEKKQYKKREYTKPKEWKKRTDLVKTENANRNATKQAWSDKNSTQKKLRLHNQIDEDMLSLFENLTNFQGYIKSLVRADIAKGDAGTFNDFLKSEKID